MDDRLCFDAVWGQLLHLWLDLSAPFPELPQIELCFSVGLSLLPNPRRLQGPGPNTLTSLVARGAFRLSPEDDPK